MSPFEKFLNDFPEGGVALFDEIGNMGGNETPKGQLMAKFYPILDEGKWVSPQGKVYDLRKYRFVFTSNEGEEFLQGLTTDDLRRAQWKMVNNRETLRDFLIRQHRWPEAFVGRFKGNLTLFEPITADVRQRIARKFVASAITPLVQEHGIGTFEVSEDFYQKLGDAFFSHSEGARSIKGVVDDCLTDFVGEIILDSYDSGNPPETSIKLDFEDTYWGKFAYHGATPPARAVTFRAKLTTQGTEKEYKYDVTKDAFQVLLSGPDDIYRVSGHEAGHAIVNDPTLTGERLEYVTTRATRAHGGYARYETMARRLTMTRQQAIAHLGRMLAGGLGEEALGLGDSSGKADDLEKVRKFASDAIVKYGLSDAALGFPLRDGKVDESHPLVTEEITRILQEGRLYAQQKIRQNWLAFRLITAALIRKGELTRAEFEGAIEKANSLLYKARHPKKIAGAPFADCIKALGSD